MKMMRLIGLIAMFFALFACERESTTHEETASARRMPSELEAKKSPGKSKIVKIVDVPLLANKTPVEVERILGAPTSEEKVKASIGAVRRVYNVNGTIEFWVDFKNEKANLFFINPVESFSVASEVGASVGIDLKDQEPRESKLSHLEFSGTFNDINWHQIRIIASGDKKPFSIITLQINP